MTENQLMRLEELEQLVQELIEKIKSMEEDIRPLRDSSNDWRR